MSTATRDQTRDLPPLSLRAEFQPSSVDAEKRTAEVVWTTGARVLRGFFDPYYEELSLDPKHVRMERLQNGAPLLAAHNGSDLGAVIGVVESARLEKGKGIATVRFAKAEDDPEADKVFRKVKDGILQNISVGYRVHRLEETAEMVGKVPVMRATDWEPYELSVVPMGADDGAGIRSGDGKALNPCVMVTRQESQMPEEIKPAPTAAQSVEDITRAAAEQREHAAMEQAAAQSRATEAALRDEREREVEIRALVRRARLGDDLADKLIRENAKVEDVRKACFDHITADGAGGQRSVLSISAGEDERDKFVRGACAAIFQRAGQTRTIAAAMKNPLFADEFRGVSVDAGEFGGKRLRDLARLSLERRGVSLRGLNDEQIVDRALEYRDAGQQGTGDFPILLETAVNKIFLGRYEETPVTWRDWCGVKPLQDFRASTFYRPGTFSTLDSVTEHGEIKHKNIPDGEKMSITPSTKGNIVSLSRRAIVNDDMGVFNDLAGGLGEAAANTIEAACYLLLTSNSGIGSNYPGDTHPLFYSTRSNIGPTGAMTITTIDGARAIMAKQKDPSSNVYLNLRPAVWLGPVELEGQARVFNENATDPTANLNGVTNRVRGFAQKVVSSAYLSAQSTTRHYFFADPARYPVVAVGFINGQEAPTVTSFMSHEYDGIRFRILHDHGEAIVDYRGGVTCAGA